MADFDVVSRWEDIYAQGMQLNRYPYDSVVSFIFRHAPRDKDRKDIHVLEVGCGAGNNLWFAAREGFSVTGFDCSATAIDVARERFKKEGLQGDFSVRNFDSIDYEKDSFDIVIDRGSLSCISYDEIVNVVDDLHRILRKGGLFHFNPYSDTHTSSLDKKNQEQEYVTPERGALVDHGKITFLSRQRVCSVLKNWKIETLSHTEINQDVLSRELDNVAWWTAIARKL